METVTLTNDEIRTIGRMLFTVEFNAQPTGDKLHDVALMIAREAFIGRMDTAVGYFTANADDESVMALNG